MPHGLEAHRPQGPVPKYCPDVCKAARVKDQPFPLGPSPALSLPFSHPQVLAPGSRTLCKQNPLRKVILQQQTQPEKAALKPQLFNQSNRKITGEASCWKGCS